MVSLAIDKIGAGRRKRLNTDLHRLHRLDRGRAEVVGIWELVPCEFRELTAWSGSA